MTAPPLNVKSLLNGLMDVMDNLERAVKEDSREGSGIAEGVRAIHKQMSDLLYKNGVRSFNAEGQPFNAEFHEAVGNVYSEAVPPKHVVRVISNGYYHNDKLFRPARVVVSTNRKQKDDAGWHAKRTAAKKKPAAAERSSVNRPSWLMNAPIDSRDYRFFVGKSTENNNLEKGKAEARDAVIGQIMAAISADRSIPFAVAYKQLAKSVTPKVLAGSWERLQKNHPNVRKVQEDCFWERVRSEISGNVYNIAILMAVPRAVFDGLVKSHGEVERWAGMEMVDAGPFLEAILGDKPGGLVYDVRDHTMAERAGLRPGDLIRQVNNMLAQDASGTRRLLGRMSLSKPKFQVTFMRDFVDAPPTTIFKRRPGGGGR